MRKITGVNASSEETNKGRGRRLLRWSVLVLLVVGAGATGIYWWSMRVSLVEAQIRAALNQAGLTESDVTVEEVGLGGVRIGSLSVGDSARPALLVEEINVHFTLGGLLEQRISAVDIGRVSVALQADAAGIDLGPLGSLVGGAGGGGGFDVGSIAVASFETRLDAPQGTIALTGGGVVEQFGTQIKLSPSDGCVQVAVGDLDLSGVVLKPLSTRLCLAADEGALYWPAETVISIRAETIPIAVQSALGGMLLEADIPELKADIAVMEPFGLRLRTEAADIDLPGPAVSLDDVDLEVVFDDLSSMEGQWRLNQGRIIDLTKVTRFTRLGVVGDGQVSADGATFDLLVSDAATLSLIGSVEGVHSIADAAGRADVTIGPLIFSETGLQPQILLPMFKGLVTNVVGSTSATAGLSWRPGELRGSAEARLDDLGLSTEAARIEGVRGDLTFDSLFPPRTAEGQRLDVGSVEAGLLLTDGEVTFSLDGQGGVTVDSAAWPFAGGTIILSSGVIEPGASEQAFELAVDQVDLSAFINLLALDGASGTGVISGRVPVTIRDGDPIITGGLLTAGEPGQLSYKGNGSDAIGGGQGALVFQALEDFQYTGLTLSLDGNAQDRLTLRLNLEGSNPGLYDGYPFAININTEASFAELLRSATLGTDAIDLIRGKGDTDQ